ncbi:MAG: fatty acid desaturase, partial [Ilumatobacteraceae bacterium]
MQTIESPRDHLIDDPRPFTDAMRPSPRELVVARRFLHLKAAVIAILALGGYWSLVVAHTSVVEKLLSTVVLVIALTAAATSVFHDANHASFSTSRTVNHLAGYTGDLLGASSWIWRFKHNNLHHGNTNVVGFDADI